MILVFGKTGQVARELQKIAGTVLLDRSQVDLTDSIACQTAIIFHKPIAVINAAAFTAVDQAEDEENLANLINGELFGKPSSLPWAVILPNQTNQDCGINFLEICSRHPSQLYEALFEGLILGLLLFWGAFFKSWLKLPGLSIGIFFTGYGISRCFIELFRQPDYYYVTALNPSGYMVQISNWGFSSGQVLSIPMIIIGITIITKVIKIK